MTTPVMESMNPTALFRRPRLTISSKKKRERESLAPDEEAMQNGRQRRIQITAQEDCIINV